MRLSSKLDNPDNSEDPSPDDLTPKSPLQADIDTRHSLETNLVLQLSVVALHNSGLTIRAIADHVGVSHTTVQRIVKNERLKNLLADNQVHAKKALPKILYQVATMAISSITIEDLKKLNAFQRMITAATAIDKARLMEDLPTQNLAIRDLVPKIQDNLEKMREVYRDALETLQQKDGTHALPEGEA